MEALYRFEWVTRRFLDEDKERTSFLSGDLTARGTKDECLSLEKFLKADGFKCHVLEVPKSDEILLLVMIKDEVTGSDACLAYEEWSRLQQRSQEQ